MLYFIKDGTIHTFPPSTNCNATREKEQLRDTIPYDVRECPYCMHRWPNKED